MTNTSSLKIAAAYSSGHLKVFGRTFFLFFLQQALLKRILRIMTYTTQKDIILNNIDRSHGGAVSFSKVYARKVLVGAWHLDLFHMYLTELPPFE